MRAVTRTVIIGDAQLLALGVTPAGVLAGDIDTPEPRPFLNLKWGITNPGLVGGVAQQTTLVVWVHDLPNDYERIDAICRRLRVLLPAMVGVPDVHDYVSQVAWLGDSADLRDYGHGTITRTSSYTLNGSMTD